MLLALIGASSIGKTTFMRGIMNDIPDWITVPNLVVVNADVGEEYRLDKKRDVWVRNKYFKKWSGKRIEKEPGKWMPLMIGDKTTMWVIDSMRYMNGLQPEVVDAFKHARGGLRIIIVYTNGEDGRIMRLERCEKNHKEISLYWSIKQCLHESEYRCNMARKTYIPAGVWCELIRIRPDRKDWEQVYVIIRQWLQDPVEKWYEDYSGKGSKRFR